MLRSCITEIAIKLHLLTDLWMEYIKFESKDSPSNVEDIYTRAIRNLNPGMESQFIERYTMFKCGHL